MRTINTTTGPVEVDPATRDHVVNTSDLFEPPKMQYVDEEPEIIAVVPGTGWCTVIGEEAVPVVAFVALDDASMFGVAVGANGRIDLTDSVEKHPNFTGYTQTNPER